MPNQELKRLSELELQKRQLELERELNNPENPDPNHPSLIPRKIEDIFIRTALMTNVTDPDERARARIIAEIKVNQLNSELEKLDRATWLKLNARTRDPESKTPLQKLEESILGLKPRSTPMDLFTGRASGKLRRR